MNPAIERKQILNDYTVEEIKEMFRDRSADELFYSHGNTVLGDRANSYEHANGRHAVIWKGYESLAFEGGEYLPGARV